MYLSRIYLKDFRTYCSTVVDLIPGVNLVEGLNGAGKTNLIEAIAFLSTLRTHRVSSIAPLVRLGSHSSTVAAEFVSHGRSTKAELVITPGRSTRIRIGGGVARPRDLISRFRTVLFAPEDLAIVKGEPSGRRDFLDNLLVQRAPGYHSVIGELDRVIRQRNASLRSIRRDWRPDSSGAEELAVWDGPMVRCSAQLLRGRLLLIRELLGPVRDAYDALAPGGRVSIHYRCRFLDGIDGTSPELPVELESLEELARAAVEGRREEEMARGLTLTGPHRDDMELRIDEVSAKGYASHGECWSLALALRLGSYELLKSLDVDEGDPILLLDDVFAELDTARRDHLARVVASVEQTVITCAVGEDVPAGVSGRRMLVVPGSVEATRDS